MNRGLTYDDVLLVPNYNHADSRREASLTRTVFGEAYTLPIIPANMDTIAAPVMVATIARLGGLALLHRAFPVHMTVPVFNEVLDLLSGVSWEKHIGATVGTTRGEEERFEQLYRVGCRIFAVDVAHGHSKLTAQMVKRIKNASGTIVIAGNVATAAGADYLSSVGADAVKVGVGPGSVCTTRLVAGVGVPQLTAVMECSKVRVPIIADGGIRYPGDAAKALAAGATFVMVGGMLAGTIETGSQSYRGMASREAQEDQHGVLASYRAAEGVSVNVTPKGPVQRVLDDIGGGIRSAMTYTGVTNLDDFSRRAQFIEVSASTTSENQPHYRDYRETR